MKIKFNINNSNTIIFVSSEWEKAKTVDALYDMDISSYLIDDTTYRDRVIVRESFSQDDIDCLAIYLDTSVDFDSVPILSNLFGYISGREDFRADIASYHGIRLSQFA
jgi:hypothetical protein